MDSAVFHKRANTVAAVIVHSDYYTPKYNFFESNIRLII